MLSQDQVKLPAYPETPDFDGLASIYQWMEWATFGPWLQKCRCAFLASLQTRERALVFGDGDGRFTAKFLQKNTRVLIDAVDGSASMLRSLSTRAGANRWRIRTARMDARRWSPLANEDEPTPRYDLVVTHFFLDCLTTGEVSALAEKVRPALLADAVWVVSDFAIPRGAIASACAGILVRGLYRAFGWLTGLKVRRLPDHPAALVQAGFHCVDRRLWLAGLLVSELWALTNRPSTPFGSSTIRDPE